MLLIIIKRYHGCRGGRCRAVHRTNPREVSEQKFACTGAGGRRRTEIKTVIFYVP